MQIKEFNDCTSSNEEAVNAFLKELMSRVISVTPIYNTILGGIMYVVVYWDAN
jgi:hypothetical protein